MRRSALGLLAAIAVLGACGTTLEAEVEVDAAAKLNATPPPGTYSGPLFVQAKQDSNDWLESSGAAGRALSCDGPIYRGYMDGEIPTFGGGVQPQHALRGFLEKGPNRTPDTGFRLVRHEGDRALFTYDVDGRTKVALVVVRRTSDLDSFGEPINKSGWPWTGESWAQCDAAEYDPSADAEHDTDIWSDADRARVPTAEIQSRPANAHCSPGATTLSVKKAGYAYVRDPQGTFSGFLASSYEENSALPGDAVDTGYFHGDRHLWLAGDKQAAYVVTPQHVERWPAIVGEAVCA